MMELSKLKQMWQVLGLGLRRMRQMLKHVQRLVIDIGYYQCVRMYIALLYIECRAGFRGGGLLNLYRNR